MYVKAITTDRVEIEAPAKVNLFLEVLNRRPDGYHNINSLFQTVSLADRLECERVAQPGIEIQLVTPKDLPCDETNLISRAYQLMRSRHGLREGLRVILNKRIPIAAGLAGGSSDGAATMMACNLLFDLNLNRRHLAGLGEELGSDLPFFFSPGQALVRGRGELVTDTTFPADYWLVLVTPPLAVSTASSYARLNLGLTNPKNPFSLDGCQTVEELVTVLRRTGNDFEEVHLLSYPELGRIKEEFSGCGASLVRMTGSGPTMFGMFLNEPDEEWVRFLRQRDWEVHVVQPVYQGCSEGLV